MYIDNYIKIQLIVNHIGYGNIEYCRLPKRSDDGACNNVNRIYDNTTLC